MDRFYQQKSTFLYSFFKKTCFFFLIVTIVFVSFPDIATPVAGFIQEKVVTNFRSGIYMLNNAVNE